MMLDYLLWVITVAEADAVARILAPLGIGCEIDGDQRPNRTSRMPSDEGSSP